VHRYAGQRWDPGTGTYDMGFRDYSPGLNRFLTRDMYNGALADMSLGSNPWTMSRYTFAGGNPTSLVEYDGHLAVRDIDGGGGQTAAPPPVLGPPSPEAVALTEEQDREILGSSAVLNGELVLAPSPQDLETALDAAEKQMCALKLLCSRDGLFVSPEYWQAHALKFICIDKRADYEGWCDPSTFVRTDEVLVIPESVLPAMQQESGIGTAVKALLPQALRAGANATARNHSVYMGFADDGATWVYSGITRQSIAQRQLQHGSRFQIKEIGSGLTRGEARAIEQALILRNRGLNRINSISPNHSYYERAVTWGKAWLRTNMP
jgi:RHS repeat-associated protein